MTASQANQTQSLNTSFCISGSATRPWLQLVPSLSKTSKRYKGSYGTSYATNRTCPPHRPLKRNSMFSPSFPTVFGQFERLPSSSHPPVRSVAGCCGLLALTQTWLPRRPSRTQPFFASLAFLIGRGEGGHKHPDHPPPHQSPVTLVTLWSLAFPASPSPSVRFPELDV